MKITKYILLASLALNIAPLLAAFSSSDMSLPLPTLISAIPKALDNSALT